MNTPRCRILVEGKIDAVAIGNLLHRRGINPRERQRWRVEVVEVGEDAKEGGGVTQLLRRLPTEEKNRRLGGASGYVADADASAEDRWASIRDRMAGVGLRVPDDTTGGVVERSAGGAWLGAWVMPDNASPGALEGWLLTMAPPERQELVRHAKEATERAFGIHPHAEQRPGGLREADRGKAELLAYLAWHRKPSTNFGVSFERGRLDADAAAAGPFLKWARSLLEAAETGTR